LSDDVRATFVRVLAYMGGLAILAIAAASFFRAPAVVTAFDTPPPPPAWLEVKRPSPAFELKMRRLAASPFRYAILRRAADGARKDIMTWGEPAGGGPYVTIELYRAGRQSGRFIDAPSEIAARILAFTVTDDVKPAGRIDSKFGAVPLVDFAIAAGGRARRCLGFARPFDAPPMQIAGWYCNARTAPVDRATLACALDHLTLISAGGNSTLDALFARAEVRRTFCGERNPILAATPERSGPIFLPAQPNLRNANSRTGRRRGRVRLQ
jgi:hypothetical protein